MRTRILGATWQRVLVACMMGVLFLMGGSVLGATAHAQARQTGTGQAVTTTRVLSFSVVAHKAPPPPYALSGDCLGTSLLGTSNSPGNWTAGGNASNGCPVAMSGATLYVNIQNNCPFGTTYGQASLQLAPPNWPNTIVKQWSVSGFALCFTCKDGTIVDTPYYTVTLTAYINARGTDGVFYYAGQVSVTFPMKQFHDGEPC